MPNEFQEVEWIGTSTTQYIDTQITPTELTRIEIRKKDYQTVWGNSSVCGCVGMTYLRFGFSTQSRESFRFGYKDKNYIATTPYDTDFHDFVLDAKNGVGKIDGVVDTTFSSTYTFTQMVPMYLGKTNNRGSSGNGGYANICLFKIYEDDVLVLDFIPCYRKSDNEIGMYDLVTQTFYTNAGTGTFMKGNDVN